MRWGDNLEVGGVLREKKTQYATTAQIMITARTPTTTRAVFVGERPGGEAEEESALPPGAG